MRLRWLACSGKVASRAENLCRAADATRGNTADHRMNVPDHQSVGILNICNRGDRSKAVTASSALRFSFFLMLALLPLNSFAQAHLLKQRPFRATDTALSGGDHICDLRRDGDGNGRPERLGDYVRVSGTVIAEPSTFETGGWLFWIRERNCAMLVYGEQENLTLGDSVSVRGGLRATNGNYFFPEAGMATMGDLAIENMGVTALGRNERVHPVHISGHDFARAPEDYAGNLIAISGLRLLDSAFESRDGTFLRAAAGNDSVLIYLDNDTGAAIEADPSRCYAITGVVVRMRLPEGAPGSFGASPAWCIAPREQCDIVPAGCYTGTVPVSWGRIKAAVIP